MDIGVHVVDWIIHTVIIHTKATILLFLYRLPTLVPPLGGC
jgi:hypothetical protein